MPTYRFIERAHVFRVACVYAATKLVLHIEADTEDEAQARARYYQRGALFYVVMGRLDE